ncbi:MAG: VWA domain-containing protein, partial [Vicinamibacteria bacterium]
MRFATAEMLWLLILMPALGLLAWSSLASHRRRLERFASPDVLPALLLGFSRGRCVIHACLRIGAIGLFVVALARPQWGRKDEPIVRRGVDVVLALDTSASMLAEDVSPNRLDQARALAGSLLDSLTGDRVALVSFGGRAAVQCPLTLDYGALRLFLDAAEPAFSPGPGTDLGRAIEEAARLFNA